MNALEKDKGLEGLNYEYQLDNTTYISDNYPSDWGINCELNLPEFDFKQQQNFSNYPLPQFQPYDPDSSICSENLSSCPTFATTPMYPKEDRLRKFLKHKLQNTQKVISVLKLELEMEQTKVQLLKQQLDSTCGLSTTNSPTLLPFQDQPSFISDIDYNEFSLDDRESFNLSSYEADLSFASDKLDQFHTQGVEITNRITVQSSDDVFQEDHYNRICDTLEGLIQDAQNALGKHPSATSLDVPLINRLRSHKSGPPSPTITSYTPLSRRSSIASFILDPKLEEGISMLMEQTRLPPSNLRTQITPPASTMLSKSNSFAMEQCSLCHMLDKLVNVCKMIVMGRISTRFPKILYYHYFQSHSYELPVTVIVLSWRWIYYIYSQCQFWPRTLLHYIINYYMPLSKFQSAKVSLFDTLITSSEKEWKLIYLNHPCPV